MPQVSNRLRTLTRFQTICRRINSKPLHTGFPSSPALLAAPFGSPLLVSPASLTPKCWGVPRLSLPTPSHPRGFKPHPSYEQTMLSLQSSRDHRWMSNWHLDPDFVTPPPSRVFPTPSEPHLHLWNHHPPRYQATCWSGPGTSLFPSHHRH